MSLNGYEWNQVSLGNSQDFDPALISIIAFDNLRHPKLIGTGFIIGAYGSSAIAVTAAHNLVEINKIQHPHGRYHPTTLPEFISNYEIIDLDRKRVRALCCNNSGIDLSIINLALWDKGADIGIIHIINQDNKTDFFNAYFSLSETSLANGEEVCILGYADMRMLSEYQDDNSVESFTMQRSLLLRSGFITNIYPSGHILCRGFCIETSIPVFPGMSGGPVFRLGKYGEKILPFGVLSSDEEVAIEIKNDRSIPGKSIVALLDTKLQSEQNGIKTIMLQVKNAYIQSHDNSGEGFKQL